MVRNIKSLVVKNTTLYYELNYVDNHYDTTYYTRFYLELKTKKVRKYWLWGELVDVPDNKEIFRVWFDIEKPTHTKEELRIILERQLELYYRPEEIKRGELL